MSTTPRPHLTGPDRKRAAKQAADLYDRGASVREVADRIGRSYGFAHKLLLEAGVTLRSRGGSRTTTGR